MRTAAALFALAHLTACSSGGSPDAFDATTRDTLDTSAADVSTPCQILCDTVTSECSNIANAYCIRACLASPRPFPYDAGTPATFDAMACLSSTADCSIRASCITGPSLAPFSPGPYGNDPLDIAAPFTLPTDTGPWSFQDEWNGGDSYVFLVYAPGELVDMTGADYSEQLFGGSILDIVGNSPPNVHYFFLNYRMTTEFDSFMASVPGDLATLPPDQAAWWQQRIHFVTTPVNMLGNWISDMFTARLAAHLGFPYDVVQWSIDRFQRIREVGQLGVLTASGTSTADWTYVGNDPTYYNFEWDREASLAAENATVIPVIQNAVVASDVMTTAVFPDAATMAGFDSMEMDLTLDCNDHYDGNCGAWDYLSNLTLCSTDPDSGTPVCNDEIARWITTYWREGRWVTNVSGLLPVFAAGGPQTMHWNASPQFTTGALYHVDLSIRLFHRGESPAPSSAQLLYQGNSFHPSDASQFAPVTFTVPPDVQSVKLYTLITGHGGVGPMDCAEFCDHVHHFRVNGTDNVREFPGAGTMSGCAENVSEGVIPNQYGTWYLGRGGWCPGFDVKPYVFDITSQIVRGAPNTLTYTPLIGGLPPNGNSGNSDVVVWLLYGR